MMTACFGNPSSLHTLGIQAEKELSAARESVARLIGAPGRPPRLHLGRNRGEPMLRFLAAGPPCPQGRHA